ncbi:bifunctional diaminohydroxyphosphoribosylaminopyrimidine deaminase/5-amino-6-(5-phosphoribosylamino)uracil reductase RibD [Allosphingosinicella sp.]|jgi:diaminohydroxyphosphoribosylaminopyrimidine deaminase/5-amino-6-(5-phosphoribosylamino)uracil reductase|uniref:bifunctional diaminohydroxyphosphoribosylaminopyrimidine deaminase/5-amino-6-(5-phosphoribosylamino)uracil reductase RibD n=1 Tax=Allosphingosinicella sp. TaxID=2823234 RepID=UPI003D762499
MRAAIALGQEARGRTAPNPNVGCVLVREGREVGRGSTQRGGRPHAEYVALQEAGDAAAGATAYVTLEPCAHRSERGPSCADILAAAGVARVVAALRDPDPRTDGAGFESLRSADIEVQVSLGADEAERSLAGFLTRLRLGRPFITLKLALSLDGRIALPSGESRWITGEEARLDVHLERARADMILVGRGTLEADDPMLDVRIEGLEDRSPRRAVLGRGPAPPGWTALAAPEAAFELGDVNDLLIEGGAGAAAAFLRADLVDRMLLYRAPIVIGEGKAALGDIGLNSLAEAHGRWRLSESRRLGIDTLEVYERVR